MATYEYTLSTDFEDGIDAVCLHSQITDYGFPQTLTSILIDDNSDTVNINFDESLSGNDEDDLDTLVENHVPGECSFIIGDIEGGNGDAESLILSSTSAKTAQLKVRLNAANVLKGRYRIGWYYEYAYTKTSDNFNAEVKLNDSDVLMSHIQEPKSSTVTQSIPVCGFAYVNLDDDDHTIDLNYWADTGTAHIKNARLEIWRTA